MAQTEAVPTGLSDYLASLAALDDLRNLGSFLRARNRARPLFDSDDGAAAFARFHSALESLSEQINAVRWRVDPTGRVVPDVVGTPGEIFEARRSYSALRAIEVARRTVVDGLHELLGRG